MTNDREVTNAIGKYEEYSSRHAADSVAKVIYKIQ